MRRLTLPLALAAAALALPAAALADGGYEPVDPASPNAHNVVQAYWFLVALCSLVFFAVFIPLGLFIVRFRSRGRGREIEGPQIRGNTRLELAWTVAPVLILAAIATFVFIKLPGIRDVARAGERPLTIKVEGRQFYWNYTYPNGVIAVDELTIPRGVAVRLEITAALNDVIHSYWVPALQGKFDAIPGKVNTTTIRAEREGVFRGVCAELCGIQHADMRFNVRVVSPAAFDRFISSDARKSELGKITWEGVCAKCHGAKGEGDIGPKLAGGAQMSQRDALTQIITQGRLTMPAVGKGWTDEQLDALVDYTTKTFAPKAANGG